MVPMVSTHRSGVARTPEQNERARGYATEAYRRTGLAHTLEYELPSPMILLRRLGLDVRLGKPPSGQHAAWQGRTVVLPTARDKDAREHGGAALHEGCHHLLHGTQHTHADVIQLTLCLAVPWATVRAAVRAGALTPEALSHRQRHAPLWLLEWRCEVIAKVFAGYDVA